MKVINVAVRVPTGQRNPFLDRPSQRTNGEVLRRFIDICNALISGGGLAGRQGRSGQGSREVASIEYATDAARATVTCAAVAGADTVTPNGQALTATQHRATGTVTIAAVLDADTVTVNGTVFTFKTALTGAANEVLRTGVNNTDATALGAAINAAQPGPAAGVYGKISARVASAVVTLYAQTGGTAGNAYTLASSNGVRLAVSGATLSGGAAVANNQFDYLGTDTTTGRALADCINNSSTAAINQHVKASCRRAIVTCASVNVGDYVDVDNVRLIAQGQATDSGGVRVTTMPDEIWCQASTDTNDGLSLANCINNHPKLRDRFFAVNATGVVSIYERFPEATVAPAIASNNATRLAITGSATAFADSPAVLVQSLQPGLAGNAKTLVTSNGTRLAITNDASGKLAGGASTTITV